MNAMVAGAPVSFGVFEMTPDDAEVLEPDDMLSILHEAGYGGVDLGPVGYFGRGEELRSRLERWGLELAGGWVELPLSDDAGFEAALPSLDDALRVFADAAEAGPRLLPKPTLADHGSPARKARPGRGAAEHALMTPRGNGSSRNTQRAVDRVRAAGFEPTFHHHAGTFVESPEEIDRFLDRVDVGLTLDTGHLVIGGGDPLEVLQRWGDSREPPARQGCRPTACSNVCSPRGGGMAEVWSSGAFVAFGRGDIDVTAVMNAVEALGFTGWVVVEQDVLPGRDISLADFRSEREADQRLNREVLRQWC